MKPIILFTFSFIQLCLFAQPDFNNYQRLESKGKLPHFLKTDISILVKEDQKNKKVHFINSGDEEEFLNLAYQRIARRFLVGDCLYGDDISNYLENLAKQAYGPSASELRNFEFITVNSNSAFVRGVYPGVVFVSTGLIAQVENEAQLAFWLLQGIAQVKLNLDQKIYLNDLEKKSNNFDLINSLSFEDEVAADSLALIQYSKSGLIMDEASTALLVKLYAYLPFEDIPFPKDYFNTPNYFIPEQQFGTKEFPIKSVDEFSTTDQKNLVKRKSKIELTTLSGGEKSFLISVENLNRIKAISRMELVRVSMRDGEYVLGLYQAFIMEKKANESIYLNRLKAFAWYNILIERETGNLSYNKTTLSNCEGEICHLFTLLTQKKKEEILTLALRQVYDLYAKHPTDPQIGTIYSKLLIRLAMSKHFNLLSYSKISFYQLDSISKLESSGTKTSSTSTKYDKIASKKGIAGVDSSEYYLYGISDILKDKTFESNYQSLKDSIAKAIVNPNLQAMSPEERYYYQREQSKRAKQERVKHFEIDSILIINPTLFVRQSNRYPTDKIIQYKADLTENLLTNAAKNEVYASLLDLNTVRTTGSTEFNKLMLYASLGKSIMNSNETNGILIDQQEFLPYINHENQRYLLFPILFCNPHGNLQYRLLLFDSEEGKVIYDQTEVLNGKPVKSIYNALIYHFFKRF